MLIEFKLNIFKSRNYRRLKMLIEFKLNFFLNQGINADLKR
jgi:hypothetical protein